MPQIGGKKRDLGDSRMGIPRELRGKKFPVGMGGQGGSEGTPGVAGGDTGDTWAGTFWPPQRVFGSMGYL